MYKFSVGGLENGIVNLINHLPAHRWRHAIVALTDIDNGFASRIQRTDVELIALHKPPGQGFLQWPALTGLFRRLCPDIVHTRNIGALEAQLPAWWAGVRGRVHGEHGWDAADPDGTNRLHLWTRRLYRPLVRQQVALGQSLAHYARHRVGVAPSRLHTVYNGVDLDRFAPRGPARTVVPHLPFSDASLWLVGTVGRMQTVKAQPVLARAFVRALELKPGLRGTLRLVFVGDGALRAECELVLAQAGVSELAWFAGERADVPDVMRALDCFVLPSLAEGISNTILEAMATGLPVIATSVGANAELVDAPATGLIVPPADVEALALALVRMASDRHRAKEMGVVGRRRVEQRFSLDTMVSAYDRIYRLALGMDQQE